MLQTCCQGIESELRQAFANARIPSKPFVATRILQLVNDSQSSVSEFAEAIRTDPALSMRLLRMANAVRFAQRTPVATVERAVTVLGLNRVKTVCLGFELVAHMDRLGNAPFDMSVFWQHSLLRACLARAIADRVVRQRKEEAFLNGLLQDCGILLLVQILDPAYAALYRSKLSPSAFYEVEQTSFRYNHVQTISAMASEWGLPENLVVPAARHHQPIALTQKPSELDRLCAVSYFVGNLRFVTGTAVNALDHGLREYGAKALGLDDSAWAEVQKVASDEYRRDSTMYEAMVVDDIDVADLLSQANRHLVSFAQESGMKVLDVIAERDTILREQRNLASALRAYRERAALDPLTNILNRGALMELVQEATQQGNDREIPIGVLFIDLDDFKQVNDTYGHVAGDVVLKSVAELLVGEVGRIGNVGRYGGEEFVVILQGVSAQATREAGERIVHRLRALDICPGGDPVAVTCSVGAIWWAWAPHTAAERLVACADQLMYKAKRSGRDRCCFDLAPGPSPKTKSQDQIKRTPDRSFLLPAPASNDSGTGMSEQELIAVAGQLNSAGMRLSRGMRKEERMNLAVPCTLRYYGVIDGSVQAEHAVARNMSSGGIGILVGRALVRGEPVEVVIEGEDSKIFLPGLVAFCRHIEGSIYDVGVQVVKHSTIPSLPQDESQVAQEHK